MRTIALSLVLFTATAIVAAGCSRGDEVVPPAGAGAVEAEGGPVRVAFMPFLPDAGYIVVAVLVGLILATAFQLLLTNLSVAAGISMLGPLDEGGGNGRKKRGSRAALPSAEEVAEEAREITAAFGLWAAITTALSLFAACWLAGELGLIERQAKLDDDQQGATNALLGALIGLTTWGLFYTLLTSLEGMAITSAVGSLIRTAMSGFRSVASATASMFEPSAKQQAADVAEGMTKAVADVLERDGDAQRLKRELRDYLRELKPRRIEAGAIRREVARLLDDLELHAVTAGGGSLPDVESMVADLRSRGSLGTEDIEAVRRGLTDALAVAREEADDPTKGAVETAADTALRLTGRSRRSAEAGRRRLEEYLRSTALPELDPDGIKGDLRRLFTEPRAGADALRARVAMIDRETVRSLLEARGDVEAEEADRVTDAIMGVVDSVAATAGGGREEVERRLSQVEGGVDSVRRQAERKLRGYLDSLGQPELDYDGVKEDVALLFHDPRAGAEALRDRWQAMDRDTLRAVIASSRSDLDEDDAEALLARLESIRDEALTQADKLKAKARRELKRVRREALEAAEEVRKVAADAAWWAFGTAAVSGAAAVVGGVLGASELFGNDREPTDRLGEPAAVMAPVGRVAPGEDDPEIEGGAPAMRERAGALPDRAVVPVEPGPAPVGVGRVATEVPDAPGPTGGVAGAEAAEEPAPGEPPSP